MQKAMKIAAMALVAMSTGSLAQDFGAGLDAAKAGDFETALREWRPLADQGDARAQTRLGLMYASGEGMPQDFAEAVRWFRLAADQGDAWAQHGLGFAYTNGKGVPQDYAEAVRWFRLAADQGEGAAQSNLGFAYANGWGVPQDFVAAHMWLNLSAAQGIATAAEFRDQVAMEMTPQSVAEAQRRASVCLASDFKDCD